MAYVLIEMVQRMDITRPRCSEQGIRLRFWLRITGSTTLIQTQQAKRFELSSKPVLLVLG